MRTRARAGYTLLELIVVMALIGIVFFFAIPRFEGSFLLDDANTSARWLIGRLQTLREDALRSRRMQTLHVDLDTGRLWVTAEGMTPGTASGVRSWRVTTSGCVTGRGVGKCSACVRSGAAARAMRPNSNAPRTVNG
jgi:prepilin-type N-terminal cleavage/methylation domain-containing protein